MLCGCKLALLIVVSGRIQINSVDFNEFLVSSVSIELESNCGEFAQAVSFSKQVMHFRIPSNIPVSYAPVRVTAVGLSSVERCT